MKSGSRLAGMAFALIVAAAACGGDEGGEDEGASARTIVAKGIMFDPKTVTIEAGKPATLTLDHQDRDVSHSLLVEAEGERFTTGVFEGPGTKTVEVTIAEPGTYAYVCEVHGSMKGDLVVE